MTTIELYINNRLVDIESPDSFSIYLKRLMITPAELSKKDAQKSYDITLPATKTNNEIFAHINAEEVKDKFARLYDARLWVGGVNIFEGKFKLSEITRSSYKGNLGIPAQKSTKDIFGDKNMNEAPEFLTSFESIADITAYNKGEKGTEDTIAGNPKIIFPFVLYGLMDKGMKDEGDTPSSGCSAKNILDDEARLRYYDFKPSVNCVELMRHFFDKEGLTLTGTALDDERINKLYASYKNPNDYEPKWPQGKIKISGTWKNTYSENGKNYFDSVYESREEKPEGNQANAVARAVYIKRLLPKDNLNSKIEPKCLDVKVESDVWGSVDSEKGKIYIPVSGLYKIKLDAKVTVGGEMYVEPLKHPLGDQFYIVAASTKGLNVLDFEYGNYRSLNGIMTEMKILHSLPEYGELSKYDLDENPTVATDNLYITHNKNKLYPLNNEVNFVDKSDSQFILCGLSWGKPYNYDETMKKVAKPPFLIYKNPVGNDFFCNLLSAKNGSSDDGKIIIATTCDGYVNSKQTRTLNYQLKIDNAPRNVIAIEKKEKPKWGDGTIHQVVWLEANTELTPVCTSSLRKETRKGPLNYYYWADQVITYDLEIEPFKYTKDWLKVTEYGTNSGKMDWNSKSDFKIDQMDIVKFLPSNIKINDWVDNFCKAFNLELRQTSTTEFELNVKNAKIGNPTANIIDLDAKASVKQGRNQSLSLPYVYDLGFTVDKNEQGYWESMARKEYDEPDETTADDGGGKYYTQSPEEKKLEQKSSFSYNWFKSIYNMWDEKNKNWFTNVKDANQIQVPIIGDKEAWANTIYDYGKYNDTRYFDKAQRFWYRDGANTVQIPLVESKGATIEAALVTDKYKSESRELMLNYKNDPHSIMTSFFLLLTDAGNSYTTVECYLTPEEYASIADSWVRYNGDLYYVAEVDGYDPMNQKQATLKLIRKML